MLNFVETWMPFEQFERQYPEYRHRYYVKINHMIVFYEIVCDEIEKKEQYPLCFSLDEVLNFLQLKSC